MPEMHFHIEWPNGELTLCYSPSTVVREYFRPGMTMTIEHLVEQSTEALGRASERVRAKYGFACARSSEQLREIVERARAFQGGEAVKIVDVASPVDDDLSWEEMLIGWAGALR